MRDSLEYYDSSNINDLVWPEDDEGQYTKHYFLPMILEGSHKYIANVFTHISIIKINHKVIPIICSEMGKKNCYVCSPFDQYIHYAIHELETIGFKPLEMVLGLILKALGVFFKFTQFNRVVYVNNWLLSTNLYMPLTKDEVQAINSFLNEKFAKHLIMYRSLNAYTNQELMATLEESGAKRIVSRQVYITDPAHPHYLKKKDFKNDRSHLRKTSFTIQEEDFSIGQAEDIKTHYDDLYLGKYTNLNPQFTLEFFKNAIQNKLYHFKLVKDEEKSLAVLGYFSRNKVMTTPIFGYDTSAPLKWGLYRLISTLLVFDSQKYQYILNQSSGAAKFKRTRGALPHIEYNFFFDQSCHFWQRLSWNMLRHLVNTIGEPVLKHYEL